MSENPFSSLSRETLEKQLINNLKHIKSLKKQIDEGIQSVEQLEQKNKELIENNNKLVDKIAILEDENEKLKQRNAASGIANIGKTITSIITQKKSELTISSKLDITNLVPHMYEESESDSPQIKALKIEIDSLNQKIKNLNQNEASIRQFSDVLQSKLEVSEMAKSSLTEKCNLLQKSLDNANSETSEINKLYQTTMASLSSLQKEYQQYRQKSTDMETQMPALLTAQQDLKAAIENRDTANAQYEHLKEEIISLRVQAEENARQVDQYKEGLKKSMRNDKEKDDIIQKYKQKLEDAELEKTELLKQIEIYKDIQTDHEKQEKVLKDQISEIQKRIDSGKASEETENKVKKMNRMLEKSNMLYAELQEKYDKNETRVRELEKQLHKARIPGIPFVKFVGPKATFVLYDNGIFQENTEAPSVQSFVFGYANKSDKSVQVSGEEQASYSEQLMRQYFLANDDTRKSIIPIIMQILGFNESQIRAETNKLRGGFKLF
ncbi:NAC domain containing protein [Trichomonas vaginalis G3]|uniref:NAC domain containing protein n=1 Tax=Trichomonas vaginalis (strain ATCC PRA-98 / G3) TaxID=412133 RepID=A2DWA5_TRIV3|nr:A-type inclusion protein-related family [Trichomonas vaginalis G3]EAY15245.1 NAC domain containing protein [Trichomonas vaginalis G3]KAI5526451.1 A-type inclusion protein-related family [Trichomonas vaginalis G3]|eukprot:XP_001327468.1 NAC domain containing protein [Trichomonas vaginalis G3]